MTLRSFNSSVASPESRINRWLDLAKPIVLGFLLVFSSHVGANTPVPEVDTAPDIDGHLDDQVWHNSLVVELTFETQPAENSPAPIRTTAHVMSTTEALYVAFRANDPNPQEIRSFLRDRDSAYQDDFVGVVLDTFNDERRAFEFLVNALGAQMDLVTNEVSGTQDDSWDAIWRSAGSVTDFGYQVEIEIPFDAMRFPNQEGPKTWGIDFFRIYPRSTRQRFAASRQDRNLNCYLCQLPKYTGFDNAQPGHEFELTPTSTFVSSETRSHPSESFSSGAGVEIGADVKWGLGTNFNLSATLNPDFSQVEADVPQLNVNRAFTLFFPEKRPFFLEGADFFESDIPLVHTRTISDPGFGLRVTGKHGATALGAFVAQDSVTNILLPGVFGSELASTNRPSSNAAFRVRRDLGKTSTLGMISTVRSSNDGYHNYVLGADGKFQPSKDHTFRFLLLGSNTRHLPDPVGQTPPSATGQAFRLQYDYSTREHSAYLTHDRRSADFRADLGFIEQVDVAVSTAGYGHRWYSTGERFWKRIRAGADWHLTRDNTGRPIKQDWKTSVWMEGNFQIFAELGAIYTERIWGEQEFDEHSLFFRGRIFPKKGIELQLFGRLGEQTDLANSKEGWIVELSPRLNWNLGRHFQANVRYTIQRLERDGGRVFDAAVGDSRLSWQFNLKQRLRLAVQYGQVVRDLSLYDQPQQYKARSEELGAQLIYSYKINPRTVFFAGYSHYARCLEQLNELVPTSKVTFAKVSYAWTP